MRAWSRPVVASVVLAVLMTGAQAYLLSGFMDWIEYLASTYLVVGGAAWALVGSLTVLGISAIRWHAWREYRIEALKVGAVFLSATLITGVMLWAYWDYQFKRLKPRFEQVIARIESGELQPVTESTPPPASYNYYWEPGALFLPEDLADASAGGFVYVSRTDDAGLHVAFRIVLNWKRNFIGFLYTGKPLPAGSWSENDYDSVGVGPCGVDIERQIAPNWYLVNYMLD